MASWLNWIFSSMSFQTIITSQTVIVHVAEIKIGDDHVMQLVETVSTPEKHSILLYNI